MAMELAFDGEGELGEIPLAGDLGAFGIDRSRSSDPSSYGVLLRPTVSEERPDD
jgi:hypothetical protein